MATTSDDDEECSSADECCAEGDVGGGHELMAYETAEREGVAAVVEHSVEEGAERSEYDNTGAEEAAA